MVKDISGLSVGRLKVEAFSHKLRRVHYYRCACSCGRVAVIAKYKLTKGLTKSCGCLRIEATKEKLTKHGQTDTRLHEIWCGMRKRCRQHRNYAGRGIAVCERWQKFENFLADMGHPPTSRHSLERIDNDAGYSPTNCRWATAQEQSNNTRRNVHVCIAGERMTMSEAARKYKVARTKVWWRLSRGWSIEEAVGLRPHKDRRVK